MKRVIVVGAGISGLSTAWLLDRRAKERNLELEIRVIEKEPQAGGKIKTFREEGFLCEWGPNGFLDNKPQTLELCRDLGVQEQLLRSNDNARKRFIFTGGELHRLPENGPQFLKSGLISLKGKMRLAMEPFAPALTESDQTLASFGRRRLGDEALRKLIAPMVSGIFAGDPETMSLQSCFPRIAELERDYGSLIMAMVKLAKKKRQEVKEGKVVASAAGPGGVLTSFRNGIQTLTDIVVNQLPEGALQERREVQRIEQGKSSPWRVVTSGGDLEADAVIVAAPAHAATGMLAGTSARIASVLGAIPYSTMTVICFGFDLKQVPCGVDGFGYLVPKEEGLSTLGSLWDSSIFENRAPEGKVLIRSMMGGACFPQYISLSDDEVTKRVRADLKRTMGIEAAPFFSRVYRHEQAIPQYVVGHGKKLDALAEECATLPGLVLTGNSYRGIGLNDCVAAAHKAVDETMAYFGK